MRKMILAAGFAVLVAAPSIASAQQTYCERSNSNRAVTGTVLGGVAGALLGSAIAGNSSNTAGTVAGGVAGAVVGNQLAKRGNEPCPQGYYETQGNYDSQNYNGQNYNGQGYAPVQASPYGYREYGPSYGAAYDPNRFWQGAPNAPEQRINFLIDRVNQGRADGSLTRGESRRVMNRITQVQREINRLRRQDRGQISGRNQNYIQNRLDDISRQIAWQRTNYNTDNRGGFRR